MQAQLVARLRMRRCLLWFCAGLVLLVLWFTQSAFSSAGIPQQRHSPALPPYLTVFLIDGLSRQVFEHGLAQGRLPNLQRLLEDGTYVRNGITCLPSMTGYCYYPLMTGLEATRSGVTGMRWFNREERAGNVRNYFGGKTARFLNEHLGASDTETIFEAARPWGWTAAAAANYNRGATATSIAGNILGLAKLKHRWWVSRIFFSLPIVPYWLAPSFPQAEDANFRNILSQLKDKPKIHWCVMGSTDSSLHALGLGKHYVEALEHIDELIGRYRDISEELGTEKNRTYAILTDHGGTNVSKNIDLSAALKNAGLRVFQGLSGATDVDFTLPLSKLTDTDATVHVNGDTFAHIYFRHPSFSSPEGWHHRVDADVLSAYQRSHDSPILDITRILLKQEGVELVVMWVSKLRLVVVQHTRGGKAHVLMNLTGALSYSLQSAKDPLGYHRCSASSLVTRDGTPKYYSASQWLEHSHNCEFPYAVVRLYQLMSSTGGSDIVVSALPGYDFGLNFEVLIGNFHGGHGGPREDQLSVPYVLSGYGIKRGVRLQTARGEDIGATLFHLVTNGQSSSARDPSDPLDPFSALGIDKQLFRGTLLSVALVDREKNKEGRELSPF